MLRHMFWNTKHRLLSIVTYTYTISSIQQFMTVQLQSSFSICSGESILYVQRYDFCEAMIFVRLTCGLAYRMYTRFFFFLGSRVTNWISLSWAQSNILNHGVKKLRGFLVSKPSMVGHLIYQMPIDEDVFIVYTMTWRLLTFTRHCFDSDWIHFFSRL